MTGDCRDVLRDLPANSIDAIVCDPPYGLAAHTTEDIEAALTAWLSRKRHKTKKKGFMGKEWDGFVPGPETWRACRRVLKPGGYVLAFAGTRTMDLMAIAIRLAGFELRDTISYLFGSGFPKGHDISKAIDRKLKKKRKVIGQRRGQGNIPNDRGKWGLKPNTPVDVTLPASQKAFDWQGFNVALKPAHEPIILARKPLDGTVAENVLKWGTGGLNIDGCRVGTDTVTINTWDDGSKPFGGGAGHPYTGRQTTGRWPSNVVLQHSDGCRCAGTKKIDGGRTDTRPEGDAGRGDKTQWRFRPTAQTRRGYADPDGTETTEQWECVDGCPVKMLDEQSGYSHSGSGSGGIWAPSTGKPAGPQHGDAGTASRFFEQFTHNDDLILHTTMEVINKWNQEIASTVAKYSNQIEKHVDSVLNAVVTSVVPGVNLSSDLKEHSIHVTQPELKIISAIAIATILSLENGYWPECGREKHSQNKCLVKFVDLCAQTGTMKIMINHLKLNGSAVPVTLKITSQNMVHGDQALARFKYCAKASRRERELGLHDFPSKNVNDGRGTSIDNPYQRGDTVRHNTHTTVKPVDLMRYLVRLVTPPNGMVLDPFTGSGTTGIACMLEGFDFFGVEREEEYAEIARHRIRFARRHPKAFRVKTKQTKQHDEPKKPEKTLWDR